MMTDIKVTLHEVETVREQLMQMKQPEVDYIASCYTLAREVAMLRRHIVDIGEALRTKAINNPDGIKADTVEILAGELLSVIP